jgi:predicted negative regulator of RcsB-dependent stress response
MATNLDLQEQEQLDALKDFWRKWGNLITWTLTAVLLAYAGYVGYQWWQRTEAAKAGVLFDEIDRLVRAGDAERAARVFADMKERYARTVPAAQAGLATAKVQFEKNQADTARASLQWVADNAVEDEYRAIARLRLAGALMDDKKYDEALKLAGEQVPPAFAALAADRRGDILHAQGKTAEAIAAYQQAYRSFEPTADYRRLVEAKLTALGAAPGAPAAAADSGASAAASAAAPAASSAATAPASAAASK